MKGKQYWNSLSMQEKFDAYVIMNNDFEYRLWMLNEESALDETFYLHILNMGYCIREDVLTV